MIITIRKTGGSEGVEEVLGRIDATRLEAGIRHLLAIQLEALADLISSHEPSAVEGVRYEVEVLGPGQASTFLVVEETGDPGHPVSRALGDLMRTLGLPVPAAAS